MPSIYVSLHTRFPGKSTELLANEVTYAGYHRVQTHTFQDWLVSGSSVQNKSRIAFAEAVGSKECITHVAISNIAGTVLESGSLTYSLQLFDHLVPQFEPGHIVITYACVSLFCSEGTSQVPLWRYEGRCLKCGELGRLDAAGGASCSKHGFYALEIVPKP